VRDVRVAEVDLDGPRVLAVVRQLEAGRVAKHVRMDREADPRHLAGSRHELADGRAGASRTSGQGVKAGGLEIAQALLADTT
jgi:hypothetical protein